MRLSIASLSSRTLALVALVALAVVAAGARAQDEDVDAGPVGRVSILNGTLQYAPQDRAGEWEAIGPNYPIATGDNLWLQGDGRAEVDYGRGQLRLGGETNVHVSRLTADGMALFVAQGGLVVRVRSLDPGEVTRVDTPNAQVDITRPGLYRIDVSADPPQTWVIVREGEALVALPGGAQQVLPGQTADVAGSGASNTVEVSNGAGLDALDTWSADRDRVYDRARQSTAYVSREMVGYADLDSYGRWESYPEYGAVWFPRQVASDWAPYRYGHWVWLTAYGWTWVDDSPWGYAPFHYGRWAYVGGRWGWCPGAFVAHPVWAPALVAWYGGAGWSYSVSYGTPVYGWVPLGWREPLVPWWRGCGTRCYERYNRPYAVNVAERPNRPPTYYANAHVPGAITAVPSGVFRTQRPVAPNRVPLNGQAFANAPRLPAAPQLKPAPAQAFVPAGRGGAPLPAGAIAAQVKPSAVAPRVPAAPIGGVAPRTPGGLPAPSRGITAAPPGGVAPAPGGNVTAVPPGGRGVPQREVSPAPRNVGPGEIRRGAGGEVPRTVPAPPSTMRVAPRAPEAVTAVPPQPSPRVLPPPGGGAPAIVPQTRVAPAPSAPVTAVPPAPRVVPPPVTNVAPAARVVPPPAVNAVPPAPPRAAAPPPVPHAAPAPSENRAPPPQPGGPKGPAPAQN